jgi:hypothetical protein
MSTSTNKTASYTKITISILTILAALATAFYTLVDGDPLTNPNLSGTAATVTENAGNIKTELTNLKADESAATTTAAAPEVVQ